MLNTYILALNNRIILCYDVRGSSFAEESAEETYGYNNSICILIVI